MEDAKYLKAPKDVCLEYCHRRQVVLFVNFGDEDRDELPAQVLVRVVCPPV